MASTQDTAVRDYLTSLRDPGALRDDSALDDLQAKLEATDDQLERLSLQQQILEAQQPPLERYENEFITHARAWAEDNGISAKAFVAEGVPGAVLRKAGFRVGRGGGGTARTRPTTSRRRGRTNAADVRAAIPSGRFTVRDVQDASGASPAVVRRVIGEAVDEGEVQNLGPDPEHTGPGRAPVVYEK